MEARLLKQKPSRTTPHEGDVQQAQCLILAGRSEGEIVSALVYRGLEESAALELVHCVREGRDLPTVVRRKTKAQIRRKSGEWRFPWQLAGEWRFPWQLPVVVYVLLVLAITTSKLLNSKGHTPWERAVALLVVSPAFSLLAALALGRVREEIKAWKNQDLSDEATRQEGVWHLVLSPILLALLVAGSYVVIGFLAIWGTWPLISLFIWFAVAVPFFRCLWLFTKGFGQVCFRSAETGVAFLMCLLALISLWGLLRYLAL